MIYVVDTSAFVVLNHFYPDTFKSLWAGIETLVSAGTFVSTREVLNELEIYNDHLFVQKWAKDHKAVFATPTSAELGFVRQILAVEHFQALIGQKALLKGSPVADPFVIAAAAVKKGTVVTQEKAKPHAAKIPNVCEHFKIPCVNLEEFMKRQNWKF